MHLCSKLKLRVFFQTSWNEKGNGTKVQGGQLVIDHKMMLMFDWKYISSTCLNILVRCLKDRRGVMAHMLLPFITSN